ncbi:MAG: hypothetical protein ISN29_09235 [Gammaproteobacteria bacterium AqS3]|nr:hypothetical protein [Gammaproteobacteria bacterium AqS3]
MSAWLAQLEPLHYVSILSIGALFYFAYKGLDEEDGMRAQIAGMAPTLLTSLGIFFTFLGVLISLLNFDVKDINDSVPEFLSGLKLAFLSSVLGLGLSLVFRWLQASKNKDQGPEEVTGRDLLNELKEMNANTLLVRDALIGEGDASLSTQFGKLRNDFRDFAEKMQQDGTDALIKALEEVIKDFNAKISEQFGENFKQLNEAVGALLEWQKQHKEQVEILTRAFEEIRTGIEKIENSTSQIPEHMEKLEGVLDQTEEHLTGLYEGISSLAEMRKSAENAVPELRESIDTVTSGMKESIDQQTDSINQQIEAMNQTMLSIQDTVNNFLETQAETANEVQSRITQSLADNVETMQRTLRALDDEMQKQLQSALDRMGNNLTSITEKFLEIYEEASRRTMDPDNSPDR